MTQEVNRNGVNIVQGEMSLVVSAMRRNVRWASHNHQDEEQDPLLHNFAQLKEVLGGVSDLQAIDVIVILGPFLDVIRSEDTTGPITGYALSAVNKFLCYGLIDPSCSSAPSGIESLADAVTHARFVGTDPSSDEVVLMKILQVLRTLLLTPVGAHLTNESVCEIMQSCFRICFELRLSELLRRTAEQTLMDMVQLLSSRLPQLKEEAKSGNVLPNIRRVFKRSGGISKRNKKSPKPKRANFATTTSADVLSTTSDTVPVAESAPTKIQTTPIDDDKSQHQPEEESKQNEESQQQSDEPQQLPDRVPGDSLSLDLCGSEGDPPSSSDVPQVSMETGSPTCDSVAAHVMTDPLEGEPGAEDDVVEKESRTSGGTEEDNRSDLEHGISTETIDNEESLEASHSDVASSESSVAQEEYVSAKGVRFTPPESHKEGHGPLVPYGLPCVRELLRFLISLINPHDRHNSEPMIHIGLSLLTVALESGAAHIGGFPSLMSLVSDEMCKNLFMLLQCDVLSLFTMALRVCFLLFEALRGHLKLQLECYFKRLLEILALDHQVVLFEKRELILDNVNQLFHVPNLVSELYVNYDCDIYCINLFEELCKALSKNAFPAGSLTTANVPALDALLQVVHVIESHCHPTIPLCTSSKPVKAKSANKTGDDDSGTDENGDTPPFSPTPPPSSGYLMAKKMKIGSARDPSSETKDIEQSNSDFFDQDDGLTHSSALAVMFASSVPTPDDLAQLKQMKKLLQAGSEQFNTKAKKGLEFLQEHGFLSKPIIPEEVANHLRENIRLDKKAIGDYIGDRKNTKVLEAFVRSFHFNDMRIDEALRTFLETFRLPGEAPVIQLILEHFSEAYFATHGQVFANADAAFTLAYAIIMLNVDQHNANMKQQKPMTPEEFKKNLRRCNGSGDYPAELLDEIYQAIRNEEIVMPSERTGRIKENYEWKLLLRRGTKPEGKYLLVSGSSFDQDLFVMIWGPTVAALSSVYDNCLEKSVVQKAITGFRKCALISAHYGLSDVFDNLVISLCKFTTLLNAPEAGESLPLSFGMNLKAQLAARTMFALAYRHGDILREGWKNILDCMLQLYRAKMLPSSMVEVEDFVDQSGKICLLREELPVTRPDSSIFSSFYQYFQMNSEPSNTKNQGSEDKEAEEKADTCIKECRPELLITESKFLRSDSLHELVKALIFASQGPEKQDAMSNSYDEDSAVFFLEQLINLTLQNRDRVSLLWASVRDHLSSIIINSTRCSFLLERTVVGLLRLAVRLLRKEEISGQVLGALRVLLMMPLNILQACGRHISYGLHELLRTNAASIRTAGDWTTIFTLLECVGAGVCPPTVTPGPASSFVSLNKDGIEEDSIEFGITGSVTSSDSDTNYIADVTANSCNGDSWLLIGKDGGEASSKNQYNLTIIETLGKHDSKSFVKSCQSLAFILRDAKHVSSDNFLRCVHAVRVFGEALVDGGLGKRLVEHPPKATEHEYRRGSWAKPGKRSTGKTKKTSPNLKTRKGAKTLNARVIEDEVEIYETINNTYDAMSLQLIELIYTLHTSASSFFPERSADGEIVESPELQSCLLWAKCWCPLLQGIAQLCCDIRKEVRMSALTYLQRALLVPDLQSLGALEWEACFNKVLFPMLSKLLAVSSQSDTVGLEETRMRAATLLSKVFLQHLNLLLSLSTFTALWLTILDFMDKYMHSDRSDLLSEAIPESLKNMLLVMSTAGIFHDDDAEPSKEEARHYTALWQVTWERIDCFLPNLRQELFETRTRTSPPVEIDTSTPEITQAPTEGKETCDTTAEQGSESEAPQASPRAGSPLLEGQQTAGSPSKVCVMLQPPLPSLAGSRSSSPTQKGSLSDVAQTPPASMPIILAPSPLSRIPISQEVNAEVSKKDAPSSLEEPVTNDSEELASEKSDSPSVIHDV